MNAEPISCASQITDAVVYSQGAVVTRRVELPESQPGDPFSLVVRGISPLARPGSFRTQVEGGREVIGLSSELKLPEVTVEGGPILEQLIELGRTRKFLEAREAGAHEQHRVISAISLKLGMRRRLRWHDPTRRIRDTLAISKLIDGRLAGIDAELLAIERELEDNAKAIAEAEAEAARARSAELAGEEIPTREVTILLSGASAGSLLSGASAGSLLSGASAGSLLNGAGGATRLDKLELLYNVGAARWWPAYSARLSDGGRSATLTLEAFVSQSTFEDWSNVSIGLCTADLHRDVRLPEMPSLRLGRAQPPKRRGFRPAPEGLDLLFAGYDRTMTEARQKKSATAAAGRAEVDNLLRAAEAQTAMFSENDFADDYLGEPEPEDEEIAAAFEKPTRRSINEMTLSAGMTPKTMSYSPEQQAQHHTQAPQAKGGSIAGMMLGAVAAPAAAAAAGVESARGRMKAKKRRAAAPAPGGYGGPTESSEMAPADAWLDFDHLRLTEPKLRRGRGRLEQRPDEGVGDRVASAMIAISDLGAPPHTADPRRSAGRFDYRYDAQASVDVPSDGNVHRIVLANASAKSEMAFRSVPREVEEVYREVSLTNPFDGPMLSGPTDVFLDGALLTTSKIDSVDRGGRVRFGLGQEERLRIARNTKTEESTHGLLGGATQVDHTVTIEIASALGSDANVEIVDRVPVTDDEDIEIEVRSATPSPEEYDQSDRGEPLRGGRLWRLKVPAGGKSKLTYQYQIELPSKCELIGGNRRE